MEMTRILKRTFDVQLDHICLTEKCKRKDAIKKIYSDWSQEEAELSKRDLDSQHSAVTKGNLTQYNKVEESSIWHQHFGYKSNVVRRVSETRDQLLANTWNQLPQGSPLYELGTFKFFELFHDYNGYILPIIDPKVSIPNSLILHELVYQEKFTAHEICSIKKEHLTKHENFLKENDTSYYESYQRNAAKCRTNMDKFLSLPKPPVWADIIKIYYYMDKNWAESCGFITQKDIQDHLRQHGDKKYNGVSNKDRMWTAPFQKAQKFVPITSSLLGRAKTRPKPIKGAI